MYGHQLSWRQKSTKIHPIKSTWNSYSHDGSMVLLYMVCHGSYGIWIMYGIYTMGTINIPKEIPWLGYIAAIYGVPWILSIYPSHVSIYIYIPAPWIILSLEKTMWINVTGFIQCGPPQWCLLVEITPVTMVISTINYSYWSYKPT